jgi:hypothetical protein
MNKLRALAVLLVLAALLSLPCRRQMGIMGIELSVSFSDRVLTDDLFTRITCRVKTSPSFAPMAEDNQIVLRLFDHGRLLLRDAFAPFVPTSKWEPEREYVFTRTIYIPPFIDEFDPAFRGSETVELNIGLGPPSGAADRPRLVVHTRTLRLVPASDAPVIVFLDGWYPPEPVPGEVPVWRRWTGREARVAIDNPGRDALLVVRGTVDAAAPADQKITIAIDGRTLEEFGPGRGDFERRYAVGKDWLGAGKDFILTVSVDRTFVPAKTVPGSTDGRELGVGISLVYFK